jgi:hypothetical protein
VDEKETVNEEKIAEEKVNPTMVKIQSLLMSISESKTEIDKATELVNQLTEEFENADEADLMGAIQALLVFNKLIETLMGLAIETAVNRGQAFEVAKAFASIVDVLKVGA